MQAVARTTKGETAMIARKKKSLLFQGVHHAKVEVDFEGGSISSDGAALLLFARLTNDWL